MTTTTRSITRITKKMMMKKITSDLLGKFFVADEGDGILNVFAFADFDEDGYYGHHNGEEGYHISDYDILYKGNFKNCCRYIDNYETEE